MSECGDSGFVNFDATILENIINARILEWEKWGEQYDDRTIQTYIESLKKPFWFWQKPRIITKEEAIQELDIEEGYNIWRCNVPGIEIKKLKLMLNMCQYARHTGKDGIVSLSGKQLKELDVQPNEDTDFKILY